jgi:hypothetical protein
MNNPIFHKIYVGILVLIVILATGYLVYTGYNYYQTPIEERFYHPRHLWFKPSGAFGHGLGIVGTLMILFGVVIYIARKRYNFLSKLIRLKYLLEFHIFLCTLGPILIVFHTAFKFGGIVSVAFWSMVAVVLSGVVGRFIYIQIPRTIEGRELGLNEVQEMRLACSQKIQQISSFDDKIIELIKSTSDGTESDTKTSYVSKVIKSNREIRSITKELKKKKIEAQERKAIIALVKEEKAISNKIGRLLTMQKLFKYWHVAHLPFALIMLIIVVIHVIVTLVFGYKWIF